MKIYFKRKSEFYPMYLNMSHFHGGIYSGKKIPVELNIFAEIIINPRMNPTCVINGPGGHNMGIDWHRNRESSRRSILTSLFSWHLDFLNLWISCILFHRHLNLTLVLFTMILYPGVLSLRHGPPKISH